MVFTLAALNVGMGGGDGRGREGCSCCHMHVARCVFVASSHMQQVTLTSNQLDAYVFFPLLYFYFA